VKKLLMTASFVLATQSSMALEVAGVTLADRAEVASQSLMLNGAGVRKKVFFDVYLAALYVPGKTQDAQAVVSGATPRRMELRMLREVSAATMHEGFVEGLKANQSEAAISALATKIAELEQVFKQVKTAAKGDVIQLDFIPGQGTRVTVRGKTYATIAGDDFAAAMLSIWLGKAPVNDGLKAALLGK
jgi:5-deoxy-D-glucuronate isomerase